MSDLSMQLPERLSRLGETGLLIPLLRLLADGDPRHRPTAVRGCGPHDRRGTARTGRDAGHRVRRPGRIVGQGLTLRPTPHRFTVDGEELYTWCALDTLIFPALLDRPARVESVSPGQRRDDPRHHRSGCRCHRRHTPPSAVVSLVNLEQITSIRSAFCNQVHYFASVDDATGWLSEHPGAEVVSVAEAYRIGNELTTSLLDLLQDDTPPVADDCPRCC